MAKATDGLRVEEVKHALREWMVRNYRPGESLPGDRVLSRQFGVSNITIAKAMQFLSVEGLVERRPRSGTYLRDWRAESPVALVTGIDILHRSASGFLRQMVATLRNLLHDASIPQELFIGHSDPGKYCSHDELSVDFFNAVEKSALRAVILAGVIPKGPWLGKLNTANIPVFGLNSDVQYGVFSTSGDAIRRAVRHLYSQGRRRFAILTPADRCKAEIPEGESRHITPNGTVALAHFDEVLTELGLEKRREWFGVTDYAGVAGAGWEETRDLWIARPHEHPDVLIVTDEGLLHNAAVALTEMNVDVPSELHVVTHMSAGITHRLLFPVSRFEVDFAAHANALVNMLKTVLSGKQPPCAHIELPAHLVMLEGGHTRHAGKPPITASRKP
ncbi:MAG: GntR family transcriptional regulator [Kiritimatiellales bacterium]|nr:GntR family transcriptional regulator [Kiritimatiellales bacterium]